MAIDSKFEIELNKAKYIIIHELKLSEVEENKYKYYGEFINGRYLYCVGYDDLMVQIPWDGKPIDLSQLGGVVYSSYAEYSGYTTH